MAYQTVTVHHKKYPWTSVMASPYNCDNTGTLDCSAKLENLKAYLSNVGEIFFPEGTYLISGDLTIPAGMIIRGPKAVINIAAGKTLTLNGPTFDDVPSFTIANTASLVINGAFNVGLRKVFTDSNAGYDGVVFGAGTVKEVCPEWWGLAPTATAAINTAAMQCAINSGVGIVRTNQGSFLINSVYWPAGISLKGVGYGVTEFDCRGSDSFIIGSEPWKHQQFRDFSVTFTNNTSGINIAAIDGIYGATGCRFQDIEIVCKNGVNNRALWIRGDTNGDGTGTANNNCYNNIYDDIRVYADSVITGQAFDLGYDGLNMRANRNIFFNSIVGSFTIGFNVAGQGNHFFDNTFNTTGMLSCIRLWGIIGGTYSNKIGSNYYDMIALPTKAVTLYSDHTTAQLFADIEEGMFFSSPSTYIECIGASPPYYHWSGHNIIMYGSSSSAYGTLDGSQQIRPFTDDGHVSLAGGLTQPTAAIYVCGQNHTNEANAGTSGGLVAVIGDLTNAKFRIAKTTTGSSMTKMAEMGNDGILNFITAPTRTTVGAAGGASALPATPSGYLEIQINGVAYQMPFYAKP